MILANNDSKVTWKEFRLETCETLYLMTIILVELQEGVNGTHKTTQHPPQVNPCLRHLNHNHHHHPLLLALDQLRSADCIKVNQIFIDMNLELKTFIWNVDISFLNAKKFSKRMT